MTFFLRWLLIPAGCFAITCLLTGCETDEIPTTPSAPFNLTRISVTRNISPAPLDTLTRGQSVTFNVQVSYTLSLSDSQFASTLQIGLDADLVDLNGIFVQEIGVFPDFTVSATASSGIQSHSFTVTIPNSGTNRFVRLNSLLFSGTAILASTSEFYFLR